MFRKNAVEGIKTHFVFNNFFTENRVVYEMVEKYCRAGRATDENMALAHGMLGT
jgi:hypothetical protein